MIPNATQIPNEIIDDILPHLTDTAFRILIIIARQTYGWIEDKTTGRRKEKDWISYKQLMSKTGRSRRAIAEAILGLEDLGLIEVLDSNGKKYERNVRSGQKLFYRIKTNGEAGGPVQKGNWVNGKAVKSIKSKGQCKKETGGGQCKKETGPVQKGNPTKVTHTKVNIPPELDQTALSPEKRLNTFSTQKEENDLATLDKQGKKTHSTISHSKKPNDDKELTSKNSLTPCTEYEIWELAKAKQVSLTEVRRVHGQVLENVGPGKRYKDHKTVYFTLSRWIDLALDRGSIQRLNEFGMMDLDDDHPDKIATRAAMLKFAKERGIFE